MQHHRRLALGIAVTLFPSAAILAQSQPAFEVASIRLDNGAFVPGVSFQQSGGPGTSDPGRFTSTQRPLKLIITSAYDIQLDQLFGPAWLEDLNGDKFTISAAMPADTTKAQFLMMFQTLLAERFHLTLHHETRSFSGYELTVAPAGAKLKEWTPEPIAADVPDVTFKPDADGFGPLRPGKPGSILSFPMGRTGLVKSNHRQSMADFAARLGSFINLSNAEPAGVATPRVADHTGLPGIYEFKIAFEGTAVMPGVPRPPETTSDPADAGPSLFTVLERQLGLKLTKVKSVPVDVLVIDRLDKFPTEN